MEVMELWLDDAKGTATLMNSTAWDSIWKIVVEDKCLVIRQSYLKAEAYTLIEALNVDKSKALEQVALIMSQIDQAITSSRPKPPKRYK